MIVLSSAQEIHKRKELKEILKIGEGAFIA